MKIIIFLYSLLTLSMSDMLDLADYLPSKENESKIYKYSINPGMPMTKFIEKYKLRDNCVEVYRKFDEFSINDKVLEIGEEFDEEDDNKTLIDTGYLKYSICIKGDVLVYQEINSSTTFSLLSKKQEWESMKILHTAYGETLITQKCRVQNKHKKSIFGKIHNILKTECDDGTYTVFANDIGIIEHGNKLLKMELVELTRAISPEM